MSRETNAKLHFAYNDLERLKMKLENVKTGNGLVQWFWKGAQIFDCRSTDNSNDEKLLMQLVKDLVCNHLLVKIARVEKEIQNLGGEL